VQDRVVAAQDDGEVDPALREQGGVVVVENEAWCQMFGTRVYWWRQDLSGLL